jgi:hypothetical protein
VDGQRQRKRQREREIGERERGGGWGGGGEDANAPTSGAQGVPMFLSLPGSSEAHTVKVNESKRLIVGLEATMKLLSKEIGKEVPGVVSV